tara:strand:- start:663 stop:974 length:312 start_codon:yes stop_codon:yes gene_type:complete
MSTKLILKRWKKEKQRIKQEAGGNGDVYKLLLDLRNSYSIMFRKIPKWHHKMNYANQIWHCDLICQYIQYLEDELNETIYNLKMAEQGFDQRNKKFGFDIKHI